MHEASPSDPPFEVPTGLAHIDMIARFNQHNRALAQSRLQEHRDALELLGRALHVLYLAANCHRKCWGGGHVMEFMAGRVYNLACAAYSLICIAYYDEALNLTRSIGEAANLVALFHMDEHAFGKWVKTTKRERIQEFGPGSVNRQASSTPIGAATPCFDGRGLKKSLVNAQRRFALGLSEILNKHIAEQRTLFDGVV